VDSRVEEFAESISVDRRLYPFDIDGSKAHAWMLHKIGLLEKAETDQIVAALDGIRLRLDRGEIPLSSRLEDIHMHVEQALIDTLGDVGRKLHSGRSRNDQVATDLRLWCRAGIDDLTSALRHLQRAFVTRCDVDVDVIIPAYTHLQRAQPVLASHYWLAYCERFERDIERLADCRRRTNRSVLGSAAVAGTSLPIDRQFVAQALGFEGISANSMDGSSDRDFVCELAFDLSMIATHLSGWAEEWIVWSTVEFGFLSLPDAFCTGSSLMPQKRNPDVLELIRGRSARAIGALQGLLLLTKGLPLAYNRDLQEDKVHLFSAYDSVLDSLALAACIVEQATLNRDVISRRLELGFLDATTLMEHLILKRIPHRTAHHLVGELVKKATEHGVALGDLELPHMRSICPEIDADVLTVLGAKNAVRAFESFGSTAPPLVARQVRNWKEKLWPHG
jgi:argininosuccinate lyase